MSHRRKCVAGLEMPKPTIEFNSKLELAYVGCVAARGIAEMECGEVTRR
jgi:hypothetical protein